jgi:hypothetical protein
MSMLIGELRDAGLGIFSRVRAGVVAVRRTTASVALLRLMIAVAVFVAWAFIPASSVPPAALLVPFGSALAVALFPRTRVVGVVLLAIAGTWLVVGEPLSVGRVLGLAAALYVAHAGAAFAAVLPHDTAVAPSALGHFALRTLLVVAVSLGLGGAGLWLAAWLPQREGIAFPLVGALVAVGLVALIAWLVRRAARP